MSGMADETLNGHMQGTLHMPVIGVSFVGLIGIALQKLYRKLVAMYGKGRLALGRISEQLEMGPLIPEDDGDESDGVENYGVEGDDGGQEESDDGQQEYDEYDEDDDEDDEDDDDEDDEYGDAQGADGQGAAAQGADRQGDDGEAVVVDSGHI
eukprot:GHVS01002758.1.p2 GENE.GHVS01002758.1~~GHVS01002758.1.p2  ORF type:complete len:153 (-),score=42.54 GHVS01002758.1:133-591(-)